MSSIGHLQPRSAQCVDGKQQADARARFPVNCANTAFAGFADIEQPRGFGVLRTWPEAGVPGKSTWRRCPDDAARFQMIRKPVPCSVAANTGQDQNVAGPCKNNAIVQDSKTVSRNKPYFEQFNTFESVSPRF